MIDTHCHIDDPQYAEGLSAFLDEQKAGGVEAMYVPGVDASSVKDVLEVCDRYPDYLFPALGLHPENVKEDWREQLQTLKAAVDERMSNSPEGVPYPIAQRPISAKGLIAIGEIGLDYHWDVTFKAEQQEALREQLRWAEQYGLPVMIHSRDAAEDTLKILREFPNVKGVMHCFSGSHEVAEQVVKMGYYLGIGGVITFKNCKLAEHLVGIPLERLVLETDAPYMAPVPYRGKRNESAFVAETMRALSYIYNVGEEEVQSTTNATVKRIFSLLKE